MVELDISQTDKTSMTSLVEDYSVASKRPEGAGEQNETYYDNTKFTKYFGYYKQIPEYKTAINAFATWVVGKGWTSDIGTTAILEGITGWGEDTFQSIIWNMLIMKKIGGDAFAEIIRNPETGTLINIKPLDPSTMRIVADKKGMILRYEQVSKKSNKKFQPQDILHLVNDRVADEIHGTSITESVEWVILTRNEAMSDLRRILHRSTIRVMEVDEDDKSRLNNLKNDYAEAIKNGELLLVPKGSGDFQDLAPPQTQHLEWIRYLENFFYQALGVPKVILGGSEEFTEASSKTAYLTYEQIYMREITELIADLFNQVGIRIDIVKPASLKNEMLSGENKNQAQTGFQPKDTEVNMQGER